MDAPTPGIRIEPGTPITLTEGAFAGISAEVAERWSGEEVVKVTAIIFGRPVQIEVDPWTLRPPLLPREDSWPEGMTLSRMLRSIKGHATDRQIRLFAVACCRRISHLMTEQRCGNLVAEREFFGTLEDWGPWSADFLMQTVEMVERAAEGEDLDTELKKAAADAELLHRVRDDFFASRDDDEPIDHELIVTCEAALAASACCADDLGSVARCAAQAVSRANGVSNDFATLAEVDPTEEAVQRDLLRDIFGRPLRLTAVDPTWLTPTVTRLAQSIYDGRVFDDMPILGDALEDAGCADEAVLAHCRGSGPHVRGCWVLDLLLGKS